MLSIIRNLTILLSCIWLTACSVVMAAKSGGIDPKEVSKCQTRACLIAAGATPVDSEKNKYGKRTSESFQANMPTGSAARAAMHGILDVSTLGLWEVAGTPIEGVKGKKTKYVIVAQYSADGSTVKHLSYQF